MAVIEVETVESVNNLEALAEWVPYGRLKSPFHLYVPAAMVDVAKRLCTDSHIPVAEIHTYHWIGDEMRFLPAYKAPADGRTAAARPAAAKPASPKAKPKAKAGQEETGAEAGQEIRTITEAQIALPSLRFTRDKRGYETTSLVHTGRRGGRSRPRILYWFRTPPGVKVGRPALDEAAIRWIEEHNPDIEFDWPKILEAQPPAAPPAEDARNRRGRRDRPRPRDPRRGSVPHRRRLQQSRPSVKMRSCLIGAWNRSSEPELLGTRTFGTGILEPELEPEPDPDPRP